MASISWDTEASDGGKILASPRPDPGNRFFAYKPDGSPIGPRRTALGNGVQHVFPFRRDYYAHLEIHHLAPSQLGDALELQQWLIDGGVVTVSSDDVNGAEYENLTLRPDTTPDIDNADDTLQRFSFTCDLRSSSPILIDYSA